MQMEKRKLEQKSGKFIDDDTDFCWKKENNYLMQLSKYTQDREKSEVIHNVSRTKEEILLCLSIEIIYWAFRFFFR